MIIPSPADVSDSVTDLVFRTANWLKHREDPRHSGPYGHADDFADLDGRAFTRSRVFSDFEKSDQRGVVSSIKWGFPRGGRPGGVWKPFSDAFRSTSHAAAIAELRLRPLPAADLIRMLNVVVMGVGTATTSKMAYFARLKATDAGECLIYDSLVRRAIRDSDDPDIVHDAAFEPFKKLLRSKRRDLTPPEQEASYGLYITAVRASAETRGIAPDQLELALFRAGRMIKPSAVFQ